MFEQEIENLQRSIRDNTIGNTQSITLKSILESNIPQNVKSYFKAEVELHLYKERMAEVRSKKFNYDQPDVRLLQEQLDLLLIYHYIFSQKEFFDACDRCAHYLFNFFCRPQWTLENFLFDEKETVTISQLAIKFKFCPEYGYYWIIIEKFLASKNKTEISKNEMTELLQKIDREIVRGNNAVELAKMTEPFFNFVYFVQGNGTDVTSRGIPTKALVYFFEDKKVHSVAEYLLKLRDQGKTILQFDELVNLLKDNFVKKGFYVEEEALHIPKPAQRQYDASNLLLPEKERLAIIKTVFGNEESKFMRTVESILSASTWDDAALALDHYFTMNDIQPYSREAIVLTNALQSYFSNQQLKDDTL